MSDRLSPPLEEIPYLRPEDVGILEGRGAVNRGPSYDDDFPIPIVYIRRALRKLSRGRWGGVAEAPPGAEPGRRL